MYIQAEWESSKFLLYVTIILSHAKGRKCSLWQKQQYNRVSAIFSYSCMLCIINLCAFFVHKSCNLNLIGQSIKKLMEINFSNKKMQIFVTTKLRDKIPSIMPWIFIILISLGAKMKHKAFTIHKKRKLKKNYDINVVV